MADYIKKHTSYINLLIILSILILLYLFYDRAKKEKNTILFSIINTHNKIENSFSDGINALSYLQITINELLDNKENLSLENVEKIKQIDAKGNFALDEPLTINITGYGGIKTDIDTKYEMAMALSLDKYFKNVATHNESYAWIYYISKNKFSSLYPFTHSKDFIFDSKNQSLPIYTDAVPENNPSGKRFFTPLYNDGVGLGLMITIGQPIYHNNRFLGTVDIDLTVSSKSSVLKSLNQFDGTYLIVNKENEIVAGDNIENFNTKKIFKVYDLVDRKLLKGAKEDQFVLSSGKYIYKKKIENTPYYLYYYIDVATVLKKSVYSTFPILLIIVLLIQLKQLLIQQLKKEEELKRKDLMILKQSRLAAMGEILSNIAHHWRQPLSTISTSATGMIVQKELDMLEDDKIIEMCTIIDQQSQYLSNTIESFNSFVESNKIKKFFNLKLSIDNCLKMVAGLISDNKIKVIVDIDSELKINNYESEFVQCVINILNNSADALENVDGERYIFIKSAIKNENTVITFKDNGGGIPKKILPHIFEPYFTTKHKSQGTGLGLSLVNNIIVNDMKGTISVDNKKYEYQDNKYKGVEFKIKIPLCCEENS